MHKKHLYFKLLLSIFSLALLKAAQESLDCLVQKLNERKTKSEILMKTINQKRRNTFMMDMHDKEAAQ